MKNNFLKTLARTIKNRPALALRYDSSMALYAAKEDEAPISEKSVKGNMKLDLVAFFTAFAALHIVFYAFACFWRRKKNKRNKK